MSTPQSFSSNILSTILRHDVKVTSYKLALLRAINDVVLSFPDVAAHDRPIAVPLRVLAEFWVAYYWPFLDPDRPIWQGPRSARRRGVANDMAFRPYLTDLKVAWEAFWRASSLPSDGYVVMNEMRVPRKRVQYPSQLQHAFDRAIKAICITLEMPIRHAGPGEWMVFDKPARYRPSSGPAVPIPGIRVNDTCLFVAPDIWSLFRDLSLWIEALCVHEWALFVEKLNQSGTVRTDRGDIYRLLTARPDNRRPLTWERNQIDILLMEGHGFVCPWTQRRIRQHTQYDIDHLVPVSIYPMNELWNLVPCDPHFNQHQKRDRLPALERLQVARPILANTYDTYALADPLAKALLEDVRLRFTAVDLNAGRLGDEIASAAVVFVDQVATFRNLARF